MNKTRANSRQRRRFTGYQKGYKSNASRKFEKTTPIGDRNESNIAIYLRDKNKARVSSILKAIKHFNPSASKHIGSKPLYKLMQYIKREQ